ncbi:hypothetical protein ABD83_03120 [Bacillus xiamenensis]|uniref:Nucleoside diphosphate kinase-like domain-containing protein n=1 Tax=Bacillus xiamenensis TaxID=1178537 RepID=A0ABT4F4K8_9BACI|nr:nucleoside-diphosphate kinase [Bacillus xiamenensis]MBG9910478.1 hypothetical protein [Bacillus xiamenensis]MCY9576979.1 hypothetical protein [Bacillus xiamenensis]
MSSERDEYGIICIKPDGMKKQGLEKRVVSYMHEKNLTIVEKRNVHLTREQVHYYFHTIFMDHTYADYLSSGKMTVFLAKGENTAYKLRRIKVELRASYGLDSSTMKNMLHSVDHGCEYYDQFSLYFPKLSRKYYCGYADLTIEMKHYEQPQKLIHILETQTNLSWGGFICSKHQVDHIQSLHSTKINMLFGMRREFKYRNKLFHLIGYVKEPQHLLDIEDGMTIDQFIHFIKSKNGSVILDYVERSDLTVGFLVYAEKQFSLDGIVLYDPRRTLKDAEELEDLIETNTSMKFCGGSGGVDSAGAMTVGKRDFAKWIHHSHLKLKDFYYEWT